MSNAILHLGAGIVCAHGGAAYFQSASQRVRINGQPVVTVVDQILVTACAHQPATQCRSGQFLGGASRVLIGGVPVALSTSQMNCRENGSRLIVVAHQGRVAAL